MTFDDPNREAVGLEPIYSGAGDNVSGALELVPADLDVTATLAGGISESSYTFGWGDGASDTTSSDGDGTATSSHTYAAAGTYTVTVTNETGSSGSQQVTVTAPAAGGESFDPSEHTVAEVEEYLEEHPDERDAVLEAEAHGKARVTLLGNEDE